MVAKRGGKKILVGAGFFSGLKNAFSKVHKLIKKTGVVGKLAPGPIGQGARILGYGKKKARGRKPKKGGASQMYRL